jgi:nucleotide-binding universal stress UspA family protein
VTEAVEAGVPYSKIVEKADEENADMIIMPTHGRTGFNRCCWGVRRVVAHRPVPSIRPAKGN